MNRLLLILLLVSFSALSDAEKLDTVLYRIVYNAETRETENGKIAAETAYLDIGNEVTYFYNHDFMMYNAVCDSLKERGYGVHEVAHYIAAKKIVIPKMVFSVLRNYPSAGKTLYAHFVFENYYYYEEETPQIDWQLIAGDTTLLGYQCQKATCKFRGRDWTVYYTMDIPISEGPWKLCGLPGLVLYARESLGEFTFSCAGIEKPENVYIEVSKKLWTKVGQKEMEELLIKFFDDQLDWITRAAGLGYIADALKRNKNVKKTSLVPCLIETFE